MGESCTEYLKTDVSLRVHHHFPPTRAAPQASAISSETTAEGVPRGTTELDSQLCFYNDLFGWARIVFLALADRPPPDPFFGPTAAGMYHILVLHAPRPSPCCCSVPIQQLAHFPLVLVRLACSRCFRGNAPGLTDLLNAAFPVDDR